jgi:atypical dual specificity phosphatase
MYAYELEGLSLTGPQGRLLKPLTLAIRGRCVTVLLGPGGSGKTLLLRALATLPLPEGIASSGCIRFEGRALAEAETRGAIAYFPQRRAVDRHGIALGAVLDHGAHVLLLDEPDRAIDEALRARLIAALRARAARGAALVVTHDLGFARAIADDVVLLCAGDVIAAGPAPSFFDAPPNELARRFVRQGNCWPAPTPPPLPSHFRWIERDRLAGMARPGVLGELDDELAAIGLGAGIDHVVSLTTEPLPSAKLAAFGLRGTHFPIDDMGVPPLGRTATLCGTIERAIAAGERVALHCHAGLGRTGTVAAAYLIWRGQRAAQALASLRRIEPAFVQSRDQERFLSAFAESVGRG